MTDTLQSKFGSTLDSGDIDGFFDGEVGIGISTKNPWLEIGQSSVTDKPIPIFSWVKNKLDSLGIYLNGPTRMSNQKAWRFRTGSKIVIVKYRKIIGSRHPNKIKKLKEIENFKYGKKSKCNYRSRGPYPIKSEF